MGGTGAICHKKDKPKKQHGGKETTAGSAWKGSFQALFETLQLKLLEMFYHKGNFNHSFKWLKLYTKLLSA